MGGRRRHVPPQDPLSHPHTPPAHPSLKKYKEPWISAIASKIPTVQGLSAGLKDFVVVSEGPAVGGSVGPAVGGSVGPAVGGPVGPAAGGPVGPTVGLCVG